MDRIDNINKLLEKQEFKTTRKSSMIINNFYSLISIVIISIAVILYTNYVVPAQDAKKERLLKQIEHQKYLENRAKQIALSHKLNSQKSTNETK